MKHYLTPESSNVYSVAYDLESMKLEVHFRSGALYTYANVPPDYFATLMSAPSVGKWLMANVKADPMTHTHTHKMVPIAPVLAIEENYRIALLERDTLMQRVNGLLEEVSQLHADEAAMQTRYDAQCQELSLREARISALEAQLEIANAAAEAYASSKVH